jgi:hypothetical protein
MEATNKQLKRMNNKHLILSAAFGLAGFLTQGNAALIDLGSAKGFAVLAGSAITVAGAVNTTKITGDIGTFPTPTITGIGNVVLNGVNHAGNAVTQNAKNNLLTAYIAAFSQPVNNTVSTELGMTTKTAGVYDSAAGTFGITGELTLDAEGNPNAIFIFKMASTLITSANSRVTLTGGALSANVFWQVGSSATLGTGTSFQGNILADQSITLTTGATVIGRALALNGAVTMDNNTINIPMNAVAAVPEPSTILAGLSALGMLGLFGWRNRK